jgi:type II secretion system protein N
MKGVLITSPEDDGGSAAGRSKDKLEDKAKDKAVASEKKGDEDGSEEEEREGTYVESVAVRPAILSFLTGSKGVIFDVDIYGGDIDGKVTFGKKTSIDIDIDDVDVREISFLENLIGLPFIGEVNGKVDLEYTGKTATDMEGTVKLKIDDLMIGDKGSKLDLSKAGGGIIKGAIKFEPVEVGDLVLEMEGEEGKLKITKMEAASRHIELMGGGDVRVAQPIGLSSMNLYVKFRFLDAYVQSSAMTKSVFSTLDRITKFRQAKRTDGFWGFALRGTISGGLKPIPAKVGPGGM